jgi:hypothetical protein
VHRRLYNPHPGFALVLAGIVGASLFAAGLRLLADLAAFTARSLVVGAEDSSALSSGNPDVDPDELDWELFALLTAAESAE